MRRSVPRARSDVSWLLVATIATSPGAICRSSGLPHRWDLQRHRARTETPLSARGADRLEVRAAGDEYHLVTGLEEPTADDATDCARPDDYEPQAPNLELVGVR